MAEPISLNAARKRRAGLADDGRHDCGRYRLFCRRGCLDQTYPAALERFAELNIIAIVREELDRRR